jgi:hypothetical protein
LPMDTLMELVNNQEEKHPASQQPAESYRAADPSEHVIPPTANSPGHHYTDYQPEDYHAYSDGERHNICANWAISPHLRKCARTNPL